MSRPTLSMPNCYCGDDDTTFDLNCSCKRCNSRPSIIIHDIDKSFSKQQIEVILQKLELGKIKQIDIEDKNAYQHVSIYFEYWTSDWRLRKSLRNGKNAKISFLDEYNETCEWELMAVKNEPKYINPTWKKDVQPVLQLQADYIDLDEPGSCTPRKDRKTKEDIRKEKENRKKYYYLKNLYQSYDLTQYEKMIEKYGEGYVWRLDNAKSIESIEQAFCKRHNLSKVNLQTNWIPQLHKDWYFDPNNKGKKIITFHTLNPMDRPIKDRVYEPLRKKMMLTIIGNWSCIGDRPYWLCQNLVNIIDDREDYTKEALKKILPSSLRKGILHSEVISKYLQNPNIKMKDQKPIVKYTVIYKRINRWDKLMETPEYMPDPEMSTYYNAVCKESPKTAFSEYTWGKEHYLKHYQKKLKKQILQMEMNLNPEDSIYRFIDSKQGKKIEQMCYFKDIAMEELLARFWLCHEMKTLINVENIVGGDNSSRTRIVNNANKLYKTLYNKTLKSDYRYESTTDIPTQFSEWQGYCECHDPNTCQECLDMNACYMCYFCNRIHIRPSNWKVWEDLYETYPRCSCQYRLITKERQEEVKHNPEKFQ